MDGSIKMISFRLNRSKKEDRMIWDFLQKNTYNRSQLIKELLFQSIKEQEGGRKKERDGEEQINQVVLLQEMKEDLKALQTMEDIKERLKGLEKKISALLKDQPPPRPLDAEEADLLNTIFRENPMEIS